MNSFYVVATPIGNLKEISERAKESFEKSAIFFCEDTRVTKKLLEMLKIDYSNKKFIVNNLLTENNLSINKELIENNNCCLVSDAGYPLLSDPGFVLINKLKDYNTKIEVVNGPCAIIHALIVSGIQMNNFYFAGFLSATSSEKRNQLFNLRKINTTLVLYEGVNKIISTLELINEVFPNNNIAVCRELTKLNETIYFGKAKDIKDEINLKGEFVIVIDNNIISDELDESLIINEINKLIKKGIDKKTISKMISYRYDLNSNDIYNLILKKTKKY